MKAVIKVYADLICKGIRTFESVPPKDKNDVRQELVERGRDDLIKNT